ncbi:abscisic stress-ripening protein 3-like [Ananas comosus]|uniref:Abscisic stress-ripening protein 3-like n=1 Tax=Ananas comosus TaxID=4615 RepID=A0A6P5GZ94_ANACO|nr:abscisic stress-ripening protein 3-like [Ananas comosus]
MAEEKKSPLPLSTQGENPTGGGVLNEEGGRSTSTMSHRDELAPSPPAFAMYERHEEKKDPEQAHKHKIEQEVAEAVAVGGAGFAFHEHHEKKEAHKHEH